MTYYYLKQGWGWKGRDRKWVQFIYPWDADKHLGESADGLGSWAANCLSVQRGFLEARLHVQLRVDFFGREHVKRVIAATSGLLHINTYAYT